MMAEAQPGSEALAKPQEAIEDEQDRLLDAYQAQLGR
jgi:hypothetical protein